MIICSQETFGPVAPLIRFKTEEEAVAVGNDTSSGLAGKFLTFLLSFVENTGFL